MTRSRPGPHCSMCQFNHWGAVSAPEIIDGKKMNRCARCRRVFIVDNKVLGEEIARKLDQELRQKEWARSRGMALK